MAERSSGKKNYKYIGIIIVLLIIIGVLLAQNISGAVVAGSTNREAAVKTVEDIYTIITENPVEVLKVDDTNGLYRVVMKTVLPNGQSNVAEALVTKDGKLIITNPINTTGYVDQLTREKTFAECLANKGIRVAGQTSDVNTVQQLRILGSFAYKLYIDCGGENLPLCQQAGIKEIPVSIYNNASYTGIQGISFYEELSGCKY